VNFIGKDQFFDVHFLNVQALQQIDRLRKIDIAIVVSQRIPIAADYVKQNRIDNCALPLPKVTITATNVSQSVPKQGLNYKRPALHETTCSHFSLCLRLQCLAAL
jgi:hypothetical protein